MYNLVFAKFRIRFRNRNIDATLIALRDAAAFVIHITPTWGILCLL